MICPRCSYESAYSTGTCPRCGTPWRAGPYQETRTPAGARTPAGPWAPASVRTPAGPWAPPDARTPGSGARYGAPPASAQTPARAQAPGFDPARWTTTDRITGAATLVLLISLFLPWFKASASFYTLSSSTSADALTAHRYMYLVLIVALLMIGYLIAYAAGKDTLGPRGSHEWLLAAASGINLLLVLIAVIFKPPGITPMFKVSLSLGAFVGLIAAVVAVAPLARSGPRARQSRLSR